MDSFHSSVGSTPQFVGSKFGISGEFKWVCSSILVDDLGLKFGFSGFGPGFVLFLAEQV